MFSHIVNKRGHIVPTPSQQSDSVNWISSFREFRDAVYHHDKIKTKQFIDFPIMNYGNEIWYLVYIRDEKKTDQIQNKIKPFTEKDFDQYFDRLFPLRFIKGILKIKSEEFYKKGQTETVSLSEGTNTIYRIIATFDKANNTFNLNLSSKTYYKDDDDGESSIDYQFKVLKNGQIKFLQIRLAG